MDWLKSLARPIVRAAYGNDFPQLIRRGAVERPHYGYIVYHSALLARRLGIPRISVVEFGVAGGRGLMNLEAQAEQVSRLTSVQIDVFGFDSGAGLPPPQDYRDLPYIWQANDFAMDRSKLEGQLQSARLVIGLVSETLKTFVSEYNPAPIGAISFDLDYYSSTVDALKILTINPEHRLPRILAYFDDIYSSDVGHVGPGVGVPLAISEFNRDNPDQDVNPLTHLEFQYGPPRAWHRQIYSCGDFSHPRFNEFILK